MTTIPLNVLDELYLNLDRELEPWTVHYELGLGAPLDPERLRSAIAAAACRHPLARARLTSWRFQDRGYDWEIVDELDEIPLTVLGHDDEPTLAQAMLAEERERLFSTSPCLESAPPFAVVLAQGREGDTLMLNLNHAAGDGISAARLMLSIVRAYAGDEDPVPPLDPLAVHDVCPLTDACSGQERRMRTRALMRGAWRPLVQAARVARDGGDDRPAYGFELVALSPEDSRVVFDLAPQGTTVNDVLLAALAVAIARWNSDHGRLARPVALSVPVNLRPPEWRHEIVSNFASWATVWVSPRPLEDLDSVIARVSEGTQAIKRDGLGGLAVDLLKLPAKLPIATKRWLQYMKPLTGDIVVDTASLSNLGKIDALPSQFDAARVGAWFSPPAQMPLGVAMGVVTVDERLHFTLRYPHSQFDRNAARRFTALYLDVLLG